MMHLQRHRRTRRACAITVLGLALLGQTVAGQSPRADASLEDIFVLRSLLLSRTPPTDFCAPDRTGFAAATSEDHYEFKAVATDAASGRVTNAGDVRAGKLHACFGPTPDSLISTFYSEGEVGGVTLVGRGQCRTTKRDFPEAGILVRTCQLDLTAVSPADNGGQLTTNTLISRATLGGESDPPGYTQQSIATIRLWKRRSEP